MGDEDAPAAIFGDRVGAVRDEAVGRAESPDLARAPGTIEAQPRQPIDRAHPERPGIGLRRDSPHSWQRGRPRCARFRIAPAGSRRESPSSVPTQRSPRRLRSQRPDPVRRQAVGAPPDSRAGLAVGTEGEVAQAPDGAGPDPAAAVRREGVDLVVGQSLRLAVAPQVLCAPGG